METENSKNKKLVQCKHCGEMIAKSAKTCPHCGAKNKKPTALIVVLIIAVLIFVEINCELWTTRLVKQVELLVY